MALVKQCCFNAGNFPSLALLNGDDGVVVAVEIGEDARTTGLGWGTSPAGDKDGGSGASLGRAGRSGKTGIATVGFAPLVSKVKKQVAERPQIVPVCRDLKKYWICRITKNTSTFHCNYPKKMEQSSLNCFCTKMLKIFDICKTLQGTRICDSMVIFKYSGVPLQRSQLPSKIYHDITYSIVMTAKEHKADFKLTTENWPRYNDPASVI